MNEVPKPGNPKYDALMKSMSKKGYDPEQGGPILVGINHRGEPHIIEGNNRAAVARDLGLPAIPADVRWYTGGERATGALSPDKLADYAYRPTPAAEKLAEKYGTAEKQIPNFPETVNPDLGQNNPTPQQMQRHGRVENVPLDAARTTQRKLQWDKFNSGQYSDTVVEGFGDRPVAGRKENGEYLIFDGHHRAALAKSSGETHMPMHVIDIKDYDPANAGKAPEAPKAYSESEIDDLYKALMEDGVSEQAPTTQDLGAKYGLPEFTTDLTPAQI
jgi:hypothetical protein